MNTHMITAITLALAVLFPVLGTTAVSEPTHISTDTVSSVTHVVSSSHASAGLGR